MRPAGGRSPPPEAGGGIKLRLVSFVDARGGGGTPRPGIWTEGGIVDIGGRARRDGMAEPHFSAMVDLIANFHRVRPALEQWEEEAAAAQGPDASDSWFDHMAPAAHLLTPGEVRLAAPIWAPRKNIFCVGKNYQEHIDEGVKALGPAEEPPADPVYFTKPPTAVVGPEEPVIHPADTGALDYEVELAVIIGRRGRDLDPETAMDWVFGYTIINDITARDVQKGRGQWFKGKGYDTFCPMGPWIVTADEVGDPHGLEISLAVNGEMRQQGSTAAMIHPIPRLLADLSRGMTLEPGDIIATGTCAGVGFSFDPPRFLQRGDRMEARIEKIGTLVNPVQ